MVYPIEHLQQLHHLQQQSSKHAQTYCELFHQTIHNTVKHATHKTNRSIDRATQNIQGYNITCQNIWKENLDGHWDHRHNTHILWKIIHGISIVHLQQLHHLQQQNSKHTQTYCELFHQIIHNTVKHATHKTNRSIDRATQNIQGYNITLTTSQVQEAIKQCKQNN